MEYVKVGIEFMKDNQKKLALLFAVALLSGPLGATAQSQNSSDAPLAIPTFHCLGLYWSPPGGAADKEVKVRYRKQGLAEWKEALPMRYNPIPKADEDLADYRGSIVRLTPATTYEVQLILAGTQTSASLTATTWSEKFPASELAGRRKREGTTWTSFLAKA